jgi:hypothetical protein
MSKCLLVLSHVLILSGVSIEPAARADTLPTFAATLVTQEFNSSEETWSISSPLFGFGDLTTDVLSPIVTLNAGATYNTGSTLAAFAPNQARGALGTITIGGVSQTATFVGAATTDSNIFTAPFLPPGGSATLSVPATVAGAFSVDFPNTIANISIDLPGVMIFTFVPSSNPGQTEMVDLAFRSLPEPTSITLSLFGLIIVCCCFGPASANGIIGKIIAVFQWVLAQ